LRNRHARKSPTGTVSCDGLLIIPKTYLHRCSSVISGRPSHISHDIRNIDVLGITFLAILLPPKVPLSLKSLYGLDILVLLLSPVSRDIAKTNLFSLVDEDGTCKGSVEHGGEFGRFSSLRGVIGTHSGYDTRLVVVLDTSISITHTVGDLLVRIPSTFLLHVDVEVVEGSLGLGQTPIRVVRSSKSAVSSVKSLAGDGQLGRKDWQGMAYWWKWKII
jgi:hypothetical protein